MAKLKRMKKKKSSGKGLTLENILSKAKEKRLELYQEIIDIDKKMKLGIQTRKDMELYLLLNLAWGQDEEVYLLDGTPNPYTTKG